MPRKGPAPKRPLVNDPVYGSPLVTQLINKVLLDGKKSTAERIVYGALEGVAQKTGADPVVTLKKAMDNVKPSLAASAARPTRSPSRFVQAAQPLWLCAGSLASQSSAARRP